MWQAHKEMVMRCALNSWSLIKLSGGQGSTRGDSLFKKKQEGAVGAAVPIVLQGIDRQHSLGCLLRLMVDYWLKGKDRTEQRGTRMLEG